MAHFNDMTDYHEENYIKYIKRYDTNHSAKQMKLFGIGVCSDTPSFPKIYEFCKLISGSGLLAADLIIS